MQNLILHSTPKEEFVNLIGEIVKEQLKIHSLEKQEEDTRLLTRKEVAKILQISLPTLNTYTKEGTIPATRLGSMIRYRKCDVDNALKDIEHIKYARK